MCLGNWLCLLLRTPLCFDLCDVLAVFVNHFSSVRPYGAKNCFAESYSCQVSWWNCGGNPYCDQSRYKFRKRRKRAKEVCQMVLTHPKCGEKVSSNDVFYGRSHEILHFLLLHVLIADWLHFYLKWEDQRTHRKGLRSKGCFVSRYCLNYWFYWVDCCFTQCPGNCFRKDSR